MKTLLLSSLVKVFKDTEPNFNEFSSFSCLKNESFSFQLAILAETAEEISATIEINSDIKNNITPYIVKTSLSEKTKVIIMIHSIMMLIARNSPTCLNQQETP